MRHERLMIIHFLRHAHAEPLDRKKHSDDQDRRLTDEGRKLIREAARGWIQCGIGFDRIFSSPYPRAAETAQIVADVYGHPSEIVHSEHLIPDAFFHKFRAEFLGSWYHLSRVLIKALQPFVWDCISVLLTGRDYPLAINMGTGSICTLEVDPAWKVPAILHGMLHAEQSALLAAKTTPMSQGRI